MAQGNVTQASGHVYTTTNTGIKYRTSNSGNPLAHNDVDANFELLRAAVNGIVSDIDGIVDKDVLTNVPTGAVFTDTVYTLPAASTTALGGIKVGANLSIDSAGTLQGASPYTHPNHSGDVTSLGDGATTITTGAVTAAKIADGAVTEAKIAAGAVTLNKLDANISTQLKVSKTVFLHVGNYYKDSTKYWASDSFNYNTTTGRYDARETTVLPFNDTEVPEVWGGYHHDSDAAIITEPFATVMAAARYVLHNHGSDCAISIIAHGHVTWHGDYDQDGTHITDLHTWASVRKLNITGGRSDDTSGSHYSTFPINGFSSARIDVTHSGSRLYAPGCWMRSVRVFIEGICFTHKHATDPRVHLRGFKIGGESKMFSEFASTRMNALSQSVSQNDYFYPWEFGEGGSAYFSSGANQPNEFWTQGNMTVFQANDAFVLYSNNAPSNQVLLHNVSSGASIRMFEATARGDIHYKHSQVQLKTGTNTPATNINTAGFYHAFNNLNLTRWGSTPLYLPGSLQTSVTQLGGSSTGNATSILNTTNSGGNYNYSDIALGSARTNYLATTTPSYYGATYPSNTLYGKFHTQANNSSLSKSTLVGDGSTQNFKSAPTSRTGTGGTSSNNAPYSDQ